MLSITELEELAHQHLEGNRTDAKEKLAEIERFMRVHREEVADRNAEITALKARVAYLEAELAKDLVPVFDKQGKAINLMRN